MQQPALRDRPLVLFAAGRRGQEQVVTHSRRAASLGITAGMPVAEAKSLCDEFSDRERQRRNSPCFLACDPAADRLALRRLAWSCDRFSPIVGLEECDTPDSLLFDVTGCAALFDGEDNLARQLQQQVEGHGLNVRIAIANTIGAAWALAHCNTRSRSIVIVTNERVADVLRSLPVTALRLSPKTLVRLQEFRLRRIDQLLALQRGSLPSRFGSELLQRIDQALGTIAEVIIPERPPEPIAATWEAEAPLQSMAALEVVITGLLETVLSRLQERGEGVQRMTARLQTPSRQEHVLTIECVRPTTDPGHLLELLQLRWEQESFPDGLCRVELIVIRAGLLSLYASSLWQTEQSEAGEREIERLIERLSSRLGTDAVLRPVLIADAQPERSFRCEPAVSTRSPPVVSAPPATDGCLSRLVRPVWLKSSPAAVEVLSADAAGPPYWFRWRQQEYTIIRHWGPERITTGWWRGDYIRRDYYHVEATHGERFWLFREFLSRRWFLHASD